jgi:hypothetical protein
MFLLLGFCLSMLPRQYTDSLSALGQLLQPGCGLPNAALPAAGEIQRGETGEDH